MAAGLRRSSIAASRAARWLCVLCAAAPQELFAANSGSSSGRSWAGQLTSESAIPVRVRVQATITQQARQNRRARCQNKTRFFRPFFFWVMIRAAKRAGSRARSTPCGGRTLISKPLASCSGPVCQSGANFRRATPGAARGRYSRADRIVKTTNYTAQRTQAG